VEGEAGQGRRGQSFCAAFCWRFSQEKVIGLVCQHQVNNVFDQRSLMDTFVVGWGGLALINAALANIDRRGPLKYFLGSLFVGPFITILLAATREDERGALRQVDVWTGRDKNKRLNN
jgi:hypothetical protein